MQGQKGRLYRDVQVYGGKALTDADATKDAIEDGLDWIQKQTTSNDVAMIFLSGHGNNDSNGKYFFLPSGFDRDRIKSTGLPWTDIVSTVQDIAGKVVLFNDSCHSGNVLGGTLKGLPPDNTGIVNELISAENGAVVFAAATGSEYAWKSPTGTTARSPRRWWRALAARRTTATRAASRSTCSRSTSPSASRR